jgi:CubicO group peptidase (beta-lactamase class C family)
MVPRPTFCGHRSEILSGQSLDVFLRQRLFEPLGMGDTDFQVPANKAARLAQCYEHAGAPPSERMVGLGWGHLEGGLRVSQDPW